MTGLSEELERAVGPIELAVDVDALANRARRRSIRRRVGSVLAIVAVASVAAVAVFEAASEPGHERVRVQTPQSARDETLVLDDGLYDIVTVDPNAHVISVRPIEITDSFQIAFVVNETVVLAAGDSTVRGVPLAGGGARYFGSGAPIPGTQPGTIWITGGGPRMRLVDDAGRVLLEKSGPPPEQGGACLDCPRVAIADVPGALVFQSATGFDVWDTTSSQVTRHLGNQESYAAPASGSTLPWCDRCARALELTDLASGKTREVTLSMNGIAAALHSARWSPDGTQLAIPEEVEPGRTARVILVDVAAGQATYLETGGYTASVAWSSDSRKLYIAASKRHETRLTVRDLDAGSTRAIAAIAAPALHLAAVISTEQAAHLLGAPRVASPQCTAARADPLSNRSATLRTDGCSYHY
jgi:hypothetical protein